MSEKIVSWFERNYSGELNEDYQPTGMKFSFAFETGDGMLVQCHDWVKCRDYLHDVVRTTLTGEASEVYGFKYTKKDNPMLDLNDPRILVSWASVKESTNIEPKLINGIKLLNYFEGIAEVELSKFEKVSGNSDKGYHHVWEIKSPKFWITHPHLISLYTLLIRLGDKSLEFTDKKSLKKAFIAVIVKYAENGEKDVDYLKVIYEKLDTIVKERKKISITNPDGFSELYFEAISIHNFHNRSGIVSTCNGETGSDRLNKQIRKMF